MLKTIFRASALKASVIKYIHTSSITRIREIFVTKPDENTTIVEAKYLPSPRIPYLLKEDQNTQQCILCQLKLEIKHTDVLILNQFINSEGVIMKRKEIGICKDQYKYIKELIHMAQHAGLLPEPPRMRPKKPYEMLNTYYDEKTISIARKRPFFPNKLKYLKLGPIERLRVKPEKGCIGPKHLDFNTSTLALEVKR